MHGRQKLLVVQVAGLGYDFLCRCHGDAWEGLTFRPADSVFPALTCPVQGSLRTAAVPDRHGMIANGLWDARYARARFWEQSAALVAGPRIWESFRAEGGTVGMLFWQQSLGEALDTVLSPAPIHKHHGGMIQDCYARPDGLYGRLCTAVGRRFNLMHYWGPCASPRSSAWIADATAALLADADAAPHLCLTYLPALDYDLQRFGTDHPRARRALAFLLEQLATLRRGAEAHGYELLIFGDYALANVTAPPVMPNALLRAHGLMSVRRVRGMAYPDFHASRAFVVADHEIGHVHVRDAGDLPAVRSVLGEHPAIEIVEGSEPLTVLAAEGSWIAYPWWEDPAEAPDYASHVDIHNKPGYDPAELFWGWPPGAVSRNPSRVRGTHGRVGPKRRIAWASTCLGASCHTVLDLAAAVREWLQTDKEA